MNFADWQLPEIQCPVWPPPPAQLIFTGEETHIWRASLNLPPFVLGKLHFNLTRRRDLALYAFAIGKPVGMDVEREQSSQNSEELIPQIASAREQAIWEILPDSVKPRAFLHLWTRKEALLKSAGTGFSLPPAQITVFTSSPEIGHNLMPDFDVSWKWVAFTPEADYLAALTAPAVASLVWFDWRQELDQTTAGSIEI
ncbi:MAG TPA: 4'-phosphopantetheinyl transferase superfamily protein [Blastocatellia bacterium]